MAVINFTNPELNTEITSLIDKKNDKIWIKANDVAVKDHMWSEYKSTFEELRDGSVDSPLPPSQGG